MFIDLTDQLRCPADHAEQYLVLLPGLMEGRHVLTGDLGCPLCGRVVPIASGIADFGGGAPSVGRTTLSAEAAAAFLGLSGPGGYVALIGGVTSLAGGLAGLLPDIGLVLVNPPLGASPAGAAGILRAARLPLKTASLRGSIVGSDYSSRPEWVQDAARSVLPGLRVIGEGGEPAEGIELLARSEECWVGRLSQNHIRQTRDR